MNHDFYFHKRSLGIAPDLRNKQATLNWFSAHQFDMVIHLAAIAGVSNYHNFPAKTLRVNLIGTYNLLEAMLKNNITRLIDLSTSEVFGTEVIDVDENSSGGANGGADGDRG